MHISIVSISPRSARSLHLLHRVLPRRTACSRRRARTGCATATGAAGALSSCDAADPRPPRTYSRSSARSASSLCRPTLWAITSRRGMAASTRCRPSSKPALPSRRAHTPTRTRAIHTLHAAPTRLYRARRHEKEHVLQLLKVKPAQVKKVKCEDSSCKFSACALLRKRKRSK